MRKIISIFISIILLCLSLTGVASVGAYFSRLDFVTQNLNFTLNGGISDKYIDKASITINYYTYDGENNVLVCSEKYPSLAQSIIIAEEAPTHDAEGNILNKIRSENEHNFLGWSITGLADTFGNKHIRLYKPGNSVSLVRLQAEQGYFYSLSNAAVDGKTDLDKAEEAHIVVNLYDVYDKNTLTIRQHSKDAFDDKYAYTVVGISAWDSMEDLINAQNGNSSSSTNLGSNVNVSDSSSTLTVNNIHFINQYQDGTFNALPPDGNIKEQFTILLSEIGLFSNLTLYKLTPTQPTLNFYFHPGRVYSSAFKSFNATMSSSQYRTQVADINGVMSTVTKTVQHYLYLYDNGEIYNTDGSLKTDGMFTGAVAPDSDVVLYAADNTPTEGVLSRSDSGFNSDGTPASSIACFTTGTLVTLADGTKIPVEKLTSDHYLRVFDHDLGRYTIAPALLVNYSGDKLYTIASLEFADGEKLEIINDRGLFDITLGRYVYIGPDNCKEFIGHKFAKSKDNGFEGVELVSAKKKYEYTGCYSVTSTYYINHFINDYLTVPGGIHWFTNYFEYDENLKYDEEAKQRDIEIYGLFTKEDFAPYIPEDMLFLFDVIYPAQYLKVTVGKGLAEFEDILTVIQEWVVYYDLSGKLEGIKPQN